MVARRPHSPEMDRDCRHHLRLHCWTRLCNPDGRCCGKEVQFGRGLPEWLTGRKIRKKVMIQESHPIVDLQFEDLDAMLKRAFRNTLILGGIASVAVLIGSTWRN